MTSILLDLKSALRALRRAPWFATLAVLTLALGIGMNTALFSLVDAVLIRSLPYTDASRLVEIWGHDNERSGMRIPAPHLDALRQRARTFQAIALHGPNSGVIRTPDGPLNIFGVRVSANYFDVLGMQPLMGRRFLPSEDGRSSPPVIAVSYGFWQRFLGADVSALGRIVVLDSTAYTVVAVMAPDFRTSFRQRSDQFWTPYVTPRIQNQEARLGYELIGRLAPGVALVDARAEVAAIGATIEFPEWGPRERRLGLVPLKNEVVGDSAAALPILFGAVGVVLVIVCANLALLQLVRSDTRIGEFAARKAIGAPTAQLFRLSLLESLMLSATGGALGIALAYGLLPVMLSLAPAEIPRIADSAINGRVLAVAAALTLVTGTAFGVLPAFRLSSLSLSEILKRTSMKVTATRSWFRSALVAGQVAASVALCVMAGLAGRTFLTLMPTNPGFDAEGVTEYFVWISGLVYPDAGDRLARNTELIRRIEAYPGVEAAGLASNMPFSGDEIATPVEQFSADHRAITPKYFDILRIPVLQGRKFTDADGASAPRVVIINQALARRLGGYVIGRVIHAGRAAPQLTYEVVGVAGDARSTGETTDIWNEIYFPFAQTSLDYGHMLVRSNIDARRVQEIVKRGVRQVAPDIPIIEDITASSVADLLRGAVASVRFMATLTAAFSILSLVLAAMGVFGLVAFSVAQRRKELGIRAALGARPQDLAFATIRPAVMLAGAGVLLGLAGAAYATRFLAAQLYAVGPLDIPTFTGAALVMLAVAGAAAAIPAARAARADPVEVLRAE